jgi:hypothetical protein
MVMRYYISNMANENDITDRADFEPGSIIASLIACGIDQFSWRVEPPVTTRSGGLSKYYRDEVVRNTRSKGNPGRASASSSTLSRNFGPLRSPGISFDEVSDESTWKSAEGRLDLAGHVFPVRSRSSQNRRRAE